MGMSERIFRLSDLITSLFGNPALNIKEKAIDFGELPKYLKSFVNI